MSSLYEIGNAVKSAADAIDAAIVAKGGSTTGGLLAAPDAIAALPSGGDGDASWVMPSDWPDIDSVLASDTESFTQKIIVLFRTRTGMTAYLKGAAHYRTSDGATYDGTAEHAHVVTTLDGGFWWCIYYTSGTFSSFIKTGYTIGNGVVGLRVLGNDSAIFPNSWLGCVSFECAVGGYTRFFGQQRDFRLQNVDLKGTLSIPVQYAFLDCQAKFINARDAVFGGSMVVSTFWRGNIVSFRGGRFDWGAITDVANFNPSQYSYFGARIPDSWMENFGQYMGSSLRSLFFGLLNLASIPDGFTIRDGVTNVQLLFYECRALTRLPPGLAIPSSVTLCDRMFFNCYSLEALPDSMDFRNCTDFSETMLNLQAIVRLPRNCQVPKSVSFAASTQVYDRDSVAKFVAGEITDGFVYNLNGAPATGLKVTLNAAIKALFSSDEVAAIEAIVNGKGWTLAW